MKSINKEIIELPINNEALNSEAQTLSIMEF